MADITEQTFRELIQEQQRTTQALGEISTIQGKTKDEIVDGKNENRIRGGIQAAITRKNNEIAEDNKKLLKDKQESSLFGKIASFLMGGKSAKKEEKKEANNRFGLLGRKLSEGFGGLKKSFTDMIPSAKGVGEGFMSGIKKAAMIGFLLLLPKILNSQFAKDTVKFLEEKIPIVFEKLKGFFKTIVSGFGPLIDFAKEPSYENFKALFNKETGIAAGIALLTALFLPFGVGKILRSTLGLAIKGLISGFGLMAGGVTALTTKLTGGDDKDKDKKAKKQPKKNPFSKIAKVAKVGARAIPGVGLIATAAFGIFDGVRAGLEEAKKETANAGTIARESISGVLSGLTFGIVKQETISKGFQNLGTKFEEGYNFLKTGFLEGVDTIKNYELPTMEDVTAGIDKAGDSIKAGYDKMTEQFELFAGKVGTIKDSLVENFEKITGIELPAMDEITTKLEEFGTNLKSRALSFIGDAKDKLVNVGKGAKEFVTGLFKKDDDTQEKIDKAVSEALKMHFETQHKAIDDFGGVSEAIARNKEREEGGAPVVINNDASVRSNSSSYGVVNESITPRNGLLTTAVSTD